MVTCPKGLPVGACCAIQKNGSVFVQEINACRDAVKRVTFTKSAAGGPPSMATSEERERIIPHIAAGWGYDPALMVASSPLIEVIFD